VNGSINASLTSAFAEFQRVLVTDYLAWQAGLVHGHARQDQFVTQNFDVDGAATPVASSVGFMPSDALTEKIVEASVKRAGLWGQQQALHFRTIMRSGVLATSTPFTTSSTILLLQCR